MLLSIVRWSRIAVPLVLLLACTLAIAGCTSGASASSSASKAPTTAPENQQYIATAIALKASATSASPAKTPVPAGPRGAREIAANAPSSGLLDSKHLAAGKGCDACHGALPAEGKPATPATAKCLSCHGGSYEAMAVKTSSLGARNPHKAHTGRQDCSRCHYAHRAFEYSCNSCHTFPTPARFEIAAPAGQTRGETSLEAAVDKTED